MDVPNAWLHRRRTVLSLRHRGAGRCMDEGSVMVMQRVFVSGRLHNTGFRDFVVRRAREHGVTGWVRNLKDGRVELFVAGDEAAATRLIDDCRAGPPTARVDTVEARADTERMPKGFTKRFTA